MFLGSFLFLMFYSVSNNSIIFISVFSCLFFWFYFPFVSVLLYRFVSYFIPLHVRLYISLLFLFNFLHFLMDYIQPLFHHLRTSTSSSFKYSMDAHHKRRTLPSKQPTRHISEDMSDILAAFFTGSDVTICYRLKSKLCIWQTRRCPYNLRVGAEKGRGKTRKNEL